MSKNVLVFPERHGRVCVVNPADKVRTHHDEWTKRALTLWLPPMGDVVADVRIAGESRRGDVLFRERKGSEKHRRRLGLLGEIARGIVLFELFRNPVTSWELLSCIVKSVEHTAQRMRAARRAKQKLSTIERTALCAITPSASAEIKREAELTLVDPQQPGLYRMAKLLRTIVVVVDELVVAPETLWLRLLGRDRVQGQAVAELLEMTVQEDLRDATFELLVKWHQSLPESARINLGEELKMNWDQTYERWKRKVLAEGRAEGKIEGKIEGKLEGKLEGKIEGKLEGNIEGQARGKAEAIIMALQARGLNVSKAQREKILACREIPQLDAWLLAAITTTNVNEMFAATVQPRPRRRSSKRAA